MSIDAKEMLNYYSRKEEEIKSELTPALSGKKIEFNNLEYVNRIDYAFLDATISETQMKKRFSFIQKLYELNKDFCFASICVFPNYVGLAKTYLNIGEPKISAVAGNFPSGQASLEHKLSEVRRVLDDGVDEVDYVFQQGLLVDRSYQKIIDELSSVKELMGNKCLKIILETGNINKVVDVGIISELALNSGCDFLKTSTGKTKVGATHEAAYMMIKAVEKHYQLTGERKGLKFSGGIGTIEEIERYAQLINQNLGTAWLSNETFRIGAGNLGLELIKWWLQRNKYDNLNTYW